MPQLLLGHLYLSVELAYFLYLYSIFLAVLLPKLFHFLEMLFLGNGVPPFDVLIYLNILQLLRGNYLRVYFSKLVVKLPLLFL